MCNKCTEVQYSEHTEQILKYKPELQQLVLQFLYQGFLTSEDKCSKIMFVRIHWLTKGDGQGRPILEGLKIKIKNLGRLHLRYGLIIATLQIPAYKYLHFKIKCLN